MPPLVWCVVLQLICLMPSFEPRSVRLGAETAHEHQARELTMEEALSGNLAESRAGILPDGEAGFISSAALPEPDKPAP